MLIKYTTIISLLLFSFFCWESKLKAQTTIDVGFEITNMGFAVDGSFDSVRVNYSFDPKTPEKAQFLVQIEAASINTGIGARDKHLRKRKYFDVEQFPLLTFQSTAMEVTAEGYHLKGMITIKGHSENIVVKVEKVIENGNDLLQTQFSLNRSTFGVGNKSFILGDEVRVKLKLFISPQA